ncbi:uncharacterized protein LOC143211202 [Lasioglossum baleicum]|uniref:uncharacterized protein LOC143211202 n=1 Tax=Lasioglossum baleicum TaxID=434251 RepID=UPI003FCE3342
MSSSEGSAFDMGNISFVSEAGTQQSSAIPAAVPTILRGRYYSIVQEKSNGTNATARCNLCSTVQEIKGQWSSTSNFISHLKRKHQMEYIEYLNDVSQAKRKNAVQRGAKSQERFEMDVAEFIIEAMIPAQAVELPRFRRIFENLDMANRVKNISRRTIGCRIDRLYVEMTEKIKSDLSTIPYLCTTADIWSGKHRSFLGVTVHWIADNYERKSAAIACRQFCGTHSYDRLKNLLHCIHRDFISDTGKIVATVTDNASNFVKAFNTFGVQRNCIGIDEIETVNGEIEEEEETGIEVEEEDEEDEEEIEEEREEEREEGIVNTVPDDVLPRHIRCAVHTLHLCVTSDLAQTIRKTEQVAVLHTEVMQKCNTLWKLCNRPKSSEIFKNVTGHILKRPGDTRWNSLYDALQQIVELKPKFIEIARALGLKNMLKDNELLYIEEHLKCTAPIAQAIDILQGDKNICYGNLVPCLISLRRKLRILSATNWRFCNVISASLLASLEKRFQHLLTFSSEESKCAAIAALSHPYFKNRWFPCVEDAQKDILIKNLKGAVVEEMKKQNVVIAAAATPSTSAEDFYYFGESTDTEQVPDYSSKASLEILHFFEDECRDLSVLDKYAHIKKIFRKYNTPVPSSASVERLFSYATMANCPKRNRTSAKLFEKRVLLKANLNYMEM